MKALHTRPSYLAPILAVACAGGITSTPAETPAPPPPAPPYPTGQLPRDVVPHAYRLNLTIDPRRESFSGFVEIDIELARATDVIWIHGLNLEVLRATFAAGGSKQEITYEQVDDLGIARLTLPKPAQPGKATLGFSYEAQFDATLEGLYRLQDGEHWYAFTQFEPISARQSFPCFDDPGFKAPFEVALTVPMRFEAASNGRAIASEPREDGMKLVRYSTTEPLPTYLVAFAVGPFDVVEGDDLPVNDHRRRPIPLRGLAVRGKGDKLAYALEHTGALVERLEDYFGIAYPYRKLDLVAVPDFAAGAMENVGLITFREWLLLIDDKTAPAEQKRAFAYVMAHELAHQWFGNLVTTAWWDDLWLNEAFATWLQYRIIQQWRPEYKAHIAGREDAFSAMEEDALVSARQIREPIRTSHDIHNAFDSITYSKGGGVLAMFESYLGPEKFQAGVRNYLERHRHSSATYEDFLAALSEGAGTDVRSAFRSFLLQPGAPYLDILPQCDGKGTTLDIKQSRYFPVGSTGNPAHTWQVPFCMRYGAGKQSFQKCALLRAERSKVELDSKGCADWLMPNADGAGYYRWKLPADDLTRLRNTEAASLTIGELLSIGDSIDASFRRGELGLGDTLRQATAFARHPDRTVAQVSMPWLIFARTYLADDASRPSVEAYTRTVYAEAAKRLQLLDNLGPAKQKVDEETRLFRKDLVEFLAFTGQDTELREALAERGRRYLGIGSGGEIDPTAIEVNLADAAVAIAAEAGDKPVIDALVERIKTETDSTLRRRFLAALAHVRDPIRAASLRPLALGPALRTSEIFRFLANMADVPQNRRATWDWIVANFDALLTRMPPSYGGYTPWFGGAFCSDDEAQAVRAFFAPRIDALPGGPRNLDGAIEAISLCAAQVRAHQPSLEPFLASTQ